MAHELGCEHGSSCAIAAASLKGSPARPTAPGGPVRRRARRARRGARRPPGPPPRAPEPPQGGPRVQAPCEARMEQGARPRVQRLFRASPGWGGRGIGGGAGPSPAVKGAEEFAPPRRPGGAAGPDNAPLFSVGPVVAPLAFDHLPCAGSCARSPHPSPGKRRAGPDRKLRRIAAGAPRHSAAPPWLWSASENKATLSSPPRPRPRPSGPAMRWCWLIALAIAVAKGRHAACQARAVHAARRPGLS